MNLLELIWLNVHIFDVMLHRSPFLDKFGADVAGDVIGFMNSLHVFLQDLESFEFLITFFTEKIFFRLFQHLAMHIFQVSSHQLSLEYFESLCTPVLRTLMPLVHSPVLPLSPL